MILKTLLPFHLKNKIILKTPLVFIDILVAEIDQILVKDTVVRDVVVVVAAVLKDLLCNTAM